jgi:hypothetical protein
MEEEDAGALFIDDMKTYNAEVTMTDENIIKLLTFKTEKDFNFFLLKWS